MFIYALIFRMFSVLLLFYLALVPKMFSVLLLFLEVVRFVTFVVKARVILDFRALLSPQRGSKLKFKYCEKVYKI